MQGSLIQLAKRDAKKFVTSGGFQVDIKLTTKSRDKNLELTGFATKHHINFDSDGLPVNSKNVHICIDEDILKLNNFPCRDAKGEVNLVGNFVTYMDSSNTDRTYIIREHFPDETLGLIVCILSDFR